MQLERLELAYSIELIRTAESAAAAVYLTVEGFSQEGPLGPPKKIPLVPVEEVAVLAAMVSEAMSVSLDRINGQHPADSRLLTSHFREVLIPLARRLTGLLIPYFVAEMILNRPWPIPIEFRVDPQLNHVPWEALYLGRDFLAFSHATGRQVVSNTGELTAPPRDRTGPLRGAFIVDPCPLDENRLTPALVKASVEMMGRWWDGPNVERIQFGEGGVSLATPLRPQRLISILQDHDVVVAVGHHSDRRRAPGSAPELEGLLIVDPAGGQPMLFPPQAFLQSLQAPNLPPELVFWLACESGLTTGWAADWPRVDRIYGFVDAAIRAGVPHFIGSSLLVPQTAAADLMEPFLEALASGCSVGESLRRARVSARRGNTDPAGGGSLVGLAFSLFGRPSHGLLSAGGRRISGMTAAYCQHGDNGMRCGRIYHLEEPGARHQRCADHSPTPTTPGAWCGDPYAQHLDGSVWVNQWDPGWVGAVRSGKDTVPTPIKVCANCLTVARRKGDWVTIQELQAELQRGITEGG